MKESVARLLKRSSFTEGFDREQIEDLSDYFESMTYSAGDRIFSQGTVGIGMGILVEGCADVIVRDDSGLERTLAQVCPGETVGEMSILEDLPRMANVVASERSTVLLITRTNFEELLGDRPSSGTRFLLSTARVLAHRIRNAGANLKKMV